MAIGCDSTAVNTVMTAGVIRLFHEVLIKLLQWMICFLHLNKLPLQHLFCYWYGGTSRSQTFSSAIGKALKLLKSFQELHLNQLNQSNLYVLLMHHCWEPIRDKLSIGS